MRTDELVTLLGTHPPAPRSVFLKHLGGTLLLTLLFAVLSVAFGLGIRPDFNVLLDDPERVFKYGFLTMLVVANGVAWWRAGQPGKSIEGPVMFVMLFSGWLFILCARSFFVKDMPVLQAEVMNDGALWCVGVTLALAAVVSIVLMRIGKAMAPVDTKAYGYLTALFAASIGAFAFSLHCQQDTPLYLATWYGMAIAGFAALAGPLLAKKMRW